MCIRDRYHLLAITPSFVQGEYWEAISEGIDKAASEMESYNITITKLFFGYTVMQSNHIKPEVNYREFRIHKLNRCV